MTEQSEREAIVAWLRDEAHHCQDRAWAAAKFGNFENAAEQQSWAKHCELLANAVARGDHLKGKSDER